MSYYNYSTAAVSSSRLHSISGRVSFSARLGPASLHQKTKTHKPEAHGSVTICVWSTQVLPFVITQLSTTGMVRTKTLFQLPPIRLLYMPSYVMMSTITQLCYLLRNWLYTGLLLVWDTWYCSAASAARSAPPVTNYRTCMIRLSKVSYVNGLNMYDYHLAVQELIIFLIVVVLLSVA